MTAAAISRAEASRFANCSKPQGSCNEGTAARLALIVAVAHSKAPLSEFRCSDLFDAPALMLTGDSLC